MALLLLAGAGGILAWPKLKGLIASGGLIPGVSVDKSGQAAAAQGGVRLPSSGPVGVRNNNPGNLRPSVIPFLGAIGTNLGFAVFDSAENGVRAMFKLLKNYKLLYGLDTIAKIARRYAPGSENNTAAWASNVAMISGIPMNARIDFNNANTMFALVKGIIGAENGRGYASAFNSVLAKAWARS